MRFLAIAVLGLLLSPGGLHAQSALITPEAARPLGLERMWFGNFSMDRSKGRLAGVHLHVSSSESHTVFSVTHEGKRYTFSERDRNAFGELIGVDGAKLKAEEKLAEIQKALETAGQADAKPPQIMTHVIPKMTLYATSDRGMVHAMDAETGQTRWTAEVGNPLYPTTPPAASDKFVAVCNGSTLYVLKAEDGLPAWSRMSVGAPGAGPAISDEMVFVPMINGQIESLLVADPKRPLATYRSFGRTLVQPVLSDNSVAWPTDGGGLYVGFAHSPGMRFRVQAMDQINSAPAFLAPDKMFATSLDGYVYCVNENRGHIIWKFTTGEPISHSPVALGNAVFAITDSGNMFAVHAASGSELWVASGIKHYLAGNEKRLYCQATRGELVVLDAATGSRLGSLDARRNDRPLLNAQTDRIFLGTSTGLVQCLRETNLPFPVLHYRFEAAKAKEPAKTPAPKPSENEKPADTPAADPFTDPFAPGAKASAPVGPAAPGAAADPFAAP